MNFISESTLIENISKKLLESKQIPYNQDPISLSYRDDYDVVDSLVYNKYNQKLKVSLFFNRELKPESCVIYMHGFGSNRTEALFLLKHLPSNISLCGFDFSAEGKSQGKFVTYGYKQKDDIRAVLGYLRTCGYTKFILWGRSMGATCTLLFTIKQKPKDVVLQILDSPFISFQEAALGLTRSRINAPEILIKVALQALKINLSTKQYNPFEIDLNKPIYSDINTVFIYSENDEVISPQNSKKIIRNYKGYFQKIIIKQRHNATRKNETIVQIIAKIKKYINASKQQKLKRKNLSLNVQTTNKKHIFNRDSFENYGIWVSAKHLQRNSNFQHSFDRCESTDKSQSSKLTQSRIQIKKRPRSSIKVYSKYQKSNKIGNFDFAENIIIEDKLKQRHSYSNSIRDIRQQLSHQIYL